VNHSKASPKPHHGDARAVSERPLIGAKPERSEIWRTPDYQSKIDALICGAEKCLWSDEGRDALDWLRRRGLEVETIRHFRLGFFPAPHRTVKSVPGLFDKRGNPSQLRAVRGVTIPWLAPGAWYSHEDGEPDGPRWVGCNVRRLVISPNRTGLCMMVIDSSRPTIAPEFRG
jgi:hypothetical protein